VDVRVDFIGRIKPMTCERRRRLKAWSGLVHVK
jgi:hypothetical protein